MQRYLVAISEEYVRDAQRYAGSVDEKDIHDSEDWVDVSGNVIIGYMDIPDNQEVKPIITKRFSNYPAESLLAYPIMEK